MNVDDTNVLSETEQEQEIATLHDYFTGIWENRRPIGQLFRTPARSYLYDTGTNKIIGCHDLVFKLLENFFALSIDKAIASFLAEQDMEEFLFAAGTIKEAMETEKILLAGNVTHFEFSSHTFDYQALIDSSLDILLLETTTRCNLRCDYCVYNAHVKDMRKHSNENMSLAVADRSVDYLKAHSYKKESVAVSFFGGEPCLDFSWLKHVVEYSQATLTQKEITFFITTNGTLITPEIAAYYFRNNFTVFVSIDGPENIHDEYRVDGNGKGSFKKAIAGVKMLVDAFGEEAEKRIRFSMVYTPPFSEKRLDRIAELWELYPWLPTKMSLHINYPSSGSIPPDKADQNALEDKTLIQWAFERYNEKYTGQGKSNPLANALMDKYMAPIASLKIYDDPADQYFPTGHCIPAVKRLFVATDGTFLLCEKITSYAPSLGNVITGLNMDTVKAIYMDEYEAISAPLCSNCWAIRLCTACYVDAFDKEMQTTSHKAKGCNKIKYFQKEMLAYYCFLKEQNPDGLNYLSDYLNV